MSETKICNGKLCNGLSKSISEFSNLSRICKKCNCHKMKEYFKTNDRPYRKLKNEIKANGECFNCGCNDIRLLEFDHIGEKEYTISRLFSKKKILSEINKTQILCIWCHRLKTRIEQDNIIEENSRKYLDIERPNDTKLGKECVGLLCNGKLQYISKFPKTKKTYCLICISYRSRTIRMNNLSFLNEIKLQKSHCQICNLKVLPETTCCFDFDHYADKLCSVSEYVRLSYDTRLKILDEVKKCRLLCCICHRIYTTSQMNFKIQEYV